jgi:hypothetical protein
MSLRGAILPAALILLGVLAIARTLTAGVGGGFGILLGVALIVAGVARIYLSRSLG